MRLTAKRKLPLQPDELVRGVTGEVLTLSRDPLKAVFLHAYSPTLEPLWSYAVAPDALGMFGRGERFSVFDRAGVASYDVDGARKQRLDFFVPGGMCVGGAAPIADGVIVAMEHDDNHPISAPVLTRIDETGAVRWTSTLPIADLDALLQGDEPECWRCSYFTAGTVVISGDVVLAVFRDMRSGIGMGYVVSLDDGAFRYSTKIGPIHVVGALEDGEFLVGYQGYGGFETYRYGRDGRIGDRWSSHGHYVVRDDDIRVVELRNDSGRMHVARLKPAGEVVRGTHLEGYYTSEPCVSSDDQLLFFRRGLIHAVRDLSTSEQLEVFDRDDSVFATPMRLGDGCVYVGFTQHRWPRGRNGPFESDSYLIRVDL